MPDPNKLTVSASQVPMLFNVSRWGTRFTLYHHFLGETALPDQEESEQMRWGKIMEPHILQRTAEEFDFLVLPNSAYFANPGLGVGCTADGWAIDPDQGLGYVQAKNVSSWAYHDDWTPSEVPLHVEMQVQTELMVPHPEYGMPRWAMVSALVDGSSPKFYRREPDQEVQGKISAEAVAFLDDVKNRREPDPFGAAPELGILVQRYPTRDQRHVIRTEDASAGTVGAHVRELEFWMDLASGAEKEAKRLKVLLLAAIQDAAEVQVPGTTAKVSVSQVDEAVKQLPSELRQDLRKVLDNPGLMATEHAAITRAINWRETLRKSYSQVRWTFKKNQIPGTWKPPVVETRIVP